MSDKKRLGGPKHISEILRIAKNELLKNHDPVDPINEFLNGEAELEKHKHIQYIFLYINGDNEYIRKIFLN